MAPARPMMGTSISVVDEATSILLGLIKEGEGMEAWGRALSSVPSPDSEPVAPPSNGVTPEPPVSVPPWNKLGTLLPTLHISTRNVGYFSVKTKSKAT